MSVWYPQARAILTIIFDGFGDTDHDSDQQVIPVLPKKVTVHRNGYKQADSWKLEFDANDLPIDPQLIRAGAVEIYLFQTDGISPDSQLLNRQITLGDDPSNTGRTSIDLFLLEVDGVIAKKRFTVANKPTIIGLFDEAGVEFDSSGKWVTISGQDYTAHLASMQWPPLGDGTARRIPVGKRLDVTLQNMLDEADPGGQLQLKVLNADVSELPIVGENETVNQRGIPIEQGTTYWDVMFKLAERYSFIIYVDNLDVVLTQPRFLTDSAQSMGRIRRMAWGRNLESMSLHRRLGKEQTPTVVVVGYDDAKKKQVTVQYPPKSMQITETTLKVGRKINSKTQVHSTRTEKERIAQKTGKVTTTVRMRDEFIIVPAHGIADEAMLLAIAESKYNLIGHAERRVIIKTKDLRDLRGDDLLNLVSGDAVVVEWDEFNSEFIASDANSHGQKVQHLVARGYGQAVSEVIADSYKRLAGLWRPLYVREATYEYSADAGISLEVELVDFIVVAGARKPEEKTPRARQPSVTETARAAANGILEEARAFARKRR